MSTDGGDATTTDSGPGGRGTPGGRDDDEERWAEAIRMARGAPPGPYARRALRRRKGLLVGLLIAPVLALALGVVIGRAIRRTGPRPEPRSDGASGDGALAWLGLGVQGVGLALVVMFAVQAWRRSRRTGPAPGLALRWGQRRDLGRQLSGREPVVPERLVVVRDLARRLLRQPPVGPLAAGFLCQGVGAVLLRQSPFRWVLGAYLALVAWALFHSWWRFQRRARAFLAEHPDGLDDPDAVRP